MMRKHITVCQWKVLQEELVCGATQVGVRCHRSFDTTRERWIFEKDDAAIGAGFIAQADLRFDALPREDFYRATCELSRRAVELAVARLEECQQLLVRLSTLVADGDAGELAVYGCEFHRFDCGGSDCRRSSFEFISFQPSRVFDLPKRFGF